MEELPKDIAHFFQAAKTQPVSPSLEQIESLIENKGSIGAKSAATKSTFFTLKTILIMLGTIGIVVAVAWSILSGDIEDSQLQPKLNFPEQASELNSLPDKSISHQLQSFADTSQVFYEAKTDFSPLAVKSAKVINKSVTSKRLQLLENSNENQPLEVDGSVSKKFKRPNFKIKIDAITNKSEFELIKKRMGKMGCTFVVDHLDRRKNGKLKHLRGHVRHDLSRTTRWFNYGHFSTQRAPITIELVYSDDGKFLDFAFNGNVMTRQGKLQPVKVFLDKQRIESQKYEGIVIQSNYGATALTELIRKAKALEFKLEFDFVERDEGRIKRLEGTLKSEVHDWEEEISLANFDTLGLGFVYDEAGRLKKTEWFDSKGVYSSRWSKKYTVEEVKSAEKVDRGIDFAKLLLQWSYDMQPWESKVVSLSLNQNKQMLVIHATDTDDDLDQIIKQAKGLKLDLNFRRVKRENGKISVLKGKFKHQEKNWINTFIRSNFNQLEIVFIHDDKGELVDVEWIQS